MADRSSRREFVRPTTLAGAGVWVSARGACAAIQAARVLAETAARKKVATQMGNQGHASDSRRKLVEYLRAGVIGNVTEVHAWTDRPRWPHPADRPTDTPAVPSDLHWDLWLGPS